MTLRLRWLAWRNTLEEALTNLSTNETRQQTTAGHYHHNRTDHRGQSLWANSCKQETCLYSRVTRCRKDAADCRHGCSLDDHQSNTSPSRWLTSGYFVPTTWSVSSLTDQLEDTGLYDAYPMVQTIVEVTKRANYERTLDVYVGF